MACRGNGNRGIVFFAVVLLQTLPYVLTAVVWNHGVLDARRLSWIYWMDQRLTRHNPVSWTRLLATFDKETPPSDDQQQSNDSSLVVPYRIPQKRRRPVRPRRPKYYWLDPQHLLHEFRAFWTELGVTANNNNNKAQWIPLIPNETLLRYYGRHDLRGALVSNGGRQQVSDMMGGAPIMEGRWIIAVKANHFELQQLLQKDSTLSPQRPPDIASSSANNKKQKQQTTRQTTKRKQSKNSGASSSFEVDVRWKHQSGRKHKGYWSLQKVIQELYEHVDWIRWQYNRPSVWMPRPSDLGLHGRADLQQAIVRYGGAKAIARRAGMVPFREWNYFEGQLDLLVELHAYCTKYQQNSNGEVDLETFPCATEIRERGYTRLYSLIQYYGGSKFVALRLGMTRPSLTSATFGDMSWGPFDLKFAIELCTLVRNDQLQQRPPLSNPVIPMPTQKKLLLFDQLAELQKQQQQQQEQDIPSSSKPPLTPARVSGLWLDAKIQEFGGYENVARRLGLALPQSF